MLASASVTLTVYGFGPIVDNAKSIGRICELEDAKENLETLDSAGDAAKAVGSGFAIGSAGLVTIAVFGAFAASTDLLVVNILKPVELAGLLFGATLPYVFSGFILAGVVESADQLITQIKTQEASEELNVDYYKPSLDLAIASSLQSTLLPCALAVGSPFLFGYLLGPRALSGLLVGAIVSGVQLAGSSAASGAAWSNAKKHIESGQLIIEEQVQEKKSEAHINSVVSDGVGDALKDASGSSISILMKFMAITALVFGAYFSKSGGRMLHYFRG